MNPKRILIAAGGTGGHFYPGFALAQAMKDQGWQPLVALKPNGPSERLLEEKGIASAALDLEGLPRSLSPKILRFGWKLIKSAACAGRIISDFKPDAVVGMGGYVSVPCLLAAARRGIPAAAHESNAILGLANRLCRSLGAKIFWGLPPLEGLKKGEALIGTPIRPELRAPAADAGKARRTLGLSPDAATLLVFGGSQGALAMNRAIPALLKSLAARAPERPFQVLHIAGEKWLEETRRLYADARFKTVVLPYISAMDEAYGAADAVICRAGASTLAELLAQKKPAVLIPYPHAAAGHQRVNASVLEKIGGAKIVEEKNLDSELPGVLEALILGPESARRRAEMAQCRKRLALPAPEETIPALVRAIEEMAR